MALNETIRSEDVGNQRWLRLIPVAMVVYIVSFMDRTNISYAFSGIGKEFHVDKAMQGTAGGIFFVGYIMLQIPGGWLAEHWSSARKFVAIMIVFWGLMAIACGPRPQLHGTRDRALLPRRRRGRHLARHSGVDQPLVSGAGASARLCLLDGQSRHLVHHHAAALGLDHLHLRLAHFVFRGGRASLHRRPAALADVHQGSPARGPLVLASRARLHRAIRLPRIA